MAVLTSAGTLKNGEDWRGAAAAARANVGGPVVLHSALIESAHLDWFDDEERRSYLAAASSFYDFGGQVLVVPYTLDDGAADYVGRLVESDLDHQDRFVLVSNEPRVPYVDFLLDRLEGEWRANDVPMDGVMRSRSSRSLWTGDEVAQRSDAPPVVRSIVSNPASSSIRTKVGGGNAWRRIVVSFGSWLARSVFRVAMANTPRSSIVFRAERRSSIGSEEPSNSPFTIALAARSDSVGAQNADTISSTHAWDACSSSGVPGDPNGSKIRGATLGTPQDLAAGAVAPVNRSQASGVAHRACADEFWDHSATTLVANATVGCSDGRVALARVRDALRTLCP